MVEAAPAPALEVIQAEFVLELLIVPLDPPAELGEADEFGGDRDRRGEVEYFVGADSPEAIPSPATPPGGVPTVSHRDARAARGAGQNRPHRPPRPLAPRHGLPRGGGQFRRQALEAHRLMPRPSHADRWAASSAPPRLRWQGAWPGRHTVVSPLTPTT